jgi:Lon protease-like protein
MSQVVLPLFPLKIVLFPQSLFPLHIFEDRYKTLIQECVAQNGEFGINLLDGNTLQEIGCTAKVVEILQRYPDGSLDIVVKGLERYSLQRIEESSTPYMTGVVTFLETPEERVDPILASHTVELYNVLLEKVYQRRIPPLTIDAPEPGLSFLLAQKAGMDLAGRQQVLETRFENDRLEIIRVHLSEVVPRLDAIQEVERIIQSDGYLNQ